MRKYEEQVKVFFRAVKIAEEIVSSSRMYDERIKTVVLNSYKSYISLVEHAGKGMATLKSLSQLEDEFLTPWNEGVGEEVEVFWKRLEAEEINYKRKDHLGNVLKSKKIRNLSEYSTVIDSMVIAQQMGKINDEDVKNLNSYIEAFEKRSRH